MYRCHDFANVPKNRRHSALEHQLPVWSPFAATGHYCVWSGNLAMIWFWDADTVSGELPGSAHRKDGAHYRIRPETVFLQRHKDGVRLQRCYEGFEMQYWQQNVLKDSFWSPEPPDEHRLNWFLGRQGIASAEPRPEFGGTLEAELSANPWGSELTLKEWLEVNERVLVASCVLVLSMILVWQETRFWRIDYLNKAVVDEFSQKQNELEPFLKARNELINLRRKNQKLSEILGTPSQAYLMSVVDRAIPNATARFQEWHYQQGELRVIVEDAEMNPVEFVRSLEAEPLFSQVKAEQAQGNNRTEITLTVGT